MASSVTRDIAQFNTRGVTAGTVTDFENLAEEFDGLPTDEEAQGEVTIATEAKDKAADDLKVAIRTIRIMAETKWGTEDGKYRTFGFEGMDDLTDNSLHRLGKRVIRRANVYLVDLASAGLTVGIISDLTALNLIFDEAIDTQTDAVKARDISTQSRVDKGNELYKEFVRLCTIGKDLWVSKDEAKYNDYVIYDTPDGTPPPEPTPP